MKLPYLLLSFFLLSISARAQVPAYVDTVGLLAWYAFDDNPNNSYGPINAGIAYGGVSYGTDRHGIPLTCYVGNGASGIDIPVNNFVTGNGARSVSAWYKMPLPQPSGNRELFATGDNSAVGHRFGVNTDITWIGWESVGLGVDDPLPIDSAWHLLVITYPVAGTGSSSIKTYFDGVLVATTYIGGTVGFMNTPVNPIHCIGTLFMPVSYGSWLYSWIGELDDIGVWGREISACDVSYLYWGGNSTLKFAAGDTQMITVCEDATYSLNTVLSANDSDVGLTDTWVVYQPPVHGALVASYSTTSTGLVMVPTGLSYTPTLGYVGPDSFAVIIHDCENTADTTRVYVNVIAPPSPPSITGPAAVCTGSSITLTATPTGGTWGAANGNATVAAGVVTGVLAGQDVIHYSISSICGVAVASHTVTVNATPAAPTVTYAAAYCQYTPYVPPTVAGTNVLWYTVATGGAGSAAAPVVNTSVPGTYYFWASQTVAGCESPRTAVTITVNPKPAPPVIDDVPNVYCPGQAFVPFTVVTGTNILWYVPDTNVAGTGVPPGINTSISGSDTVWASQTVAGCESYRSAYIVTVENAVNANFTVTKKYGCTADTVLFTNASTGTTNFSWTFGDISPVSISANPVHVYMAQGTYTVTLYAGNSPCIDSSKQVVTLVHPLKAQFLADTSLICQGGAIGFTDLSVATAPAYLWKFGDGGTSTLANPSHTYPHTGVYTVTETVTDFIPCQSSESMTIYVDSISPISISLTDNVLCRGTYTTFTGGYSDIGNTGITWNFGNGDSIRNQNPVSWAYLTTGTYTITATATYRVCPDTAATRVVTVIPSPSIYIGPDTAVCKGGEALVLVDRVNEGNPKATWLWSTGSKTASTAVTEPGSYTATVYINNCSASQTVNVANDCYLNIPNAFSPNNDGINDYFCPLQQLSKGIVSFSMEVYNRWGQQVFATSAVDTRGWDGSFNNVPQPEGVFVYIIDATFKDGQKEHHQGNVTLIR